MLNLPDFFFSGSDHGLKIVIVKKSVDLIEGLGGMIVFFYDLLAGFAFVMFALQFTLRLELFFYLLCVDF